MAIPVGVRAGAARGWATPAAFRDPLALRSAAARLRGVWTRRSGRGRRRKAELKSRSLQEDNERLEEHNRQLLVKVARLEAQLERAEAGRAPERDAAHPAPAAAPSDEKWTPPWRERALADDRSAYNMGLHSVDASGFVGRGWEEKGGGRVQDKLSDRRSAARRAAMARVSRSGVLKDALVAPAHERGVERLRLHKEIRAALVVDFFVKDGYVRVGAAEGVTLATVGSDGKRAPPARVWARLASGGSPSPEGEFGVVCSLSSGHQLAGALGGGRLAMALASIVSGVDGSVNFTALRKDKKVVVEHLKLKRVTACVGVSVTQESGDAAKANEYKRGTPQDGVTDDEVTAALAVLAEAGGHASAAVARLWAASDVGCMREAVETCRAFGLTTALDEACRSARWKSNSELALLFTTAFVLEHGSAAMIDGVRPRWHVDPNDVGGSTQVWVPAASAPTADGSCVKHTSLRLGNTVAVTMLSLPLDMVSERAGTVEHTASAWSPQPPQRAFTVSFATNGAAAGVCRARRSAVG